MMHSTHKEFVNSSIKSSSLVNENNSLLPISVQKPCDRDKRNVKKERRQSHQQQNALLSCEVMQSGSSSSEKVNYLQSQLQNLSVALQEKEIEAKGLKQALRYLQREANGKRSLYPELESQLLTSKEELMAATRRLEEQNEVVSGLKFEVMEKNQEIQYYKNENERLLRRVVALEIDLDTHEIHFTEYAERQRQLEEVALEEAFSETKTAEVLEIEERYGSRIQDLISKQITDYSVLEDRYKRDRADSAQTIRDLQAAVNDLHASVAVLENRIAGEKSVKFSLQPNSNIFRERINFLEKANAILVGTNNELMERLENLESKLGQPSRLIHQAKFVDGNNETASDSHDVRLRESQTKIAFLEKEKQFKENKISLLRAEAITYQLRNLSPIDFYMSPLSGTNGKGGDQGHHVVDSEKVPSEFEVATHPQGALQALREILVRKDRELVELRQLSKAREESLSMQLDAAHNMGGTKEIGCMQFFL